MGAIAATRRRKTTTTPSLYKKSGPDKKSATTTARNGVVHKKWCGAAKRDLQTFATHDIVSRRVLQLVNNRGMGATISKVGVTIKGRCYN